MTRSERLLAIVQLMRARQTPATAAILAGELDVSERTIYRDIALLVRRGALIEGAAGFGYVLRPGNFLPPLMFAREEADAVMLGLRYVIRRGDDALSEGARNAMAKIAEMLPADTARSARFNGLVVGPVGSRDGELIALVRSSIRLGRKLSFAYTDAEGRCSARTVWPLALGFFDEVEMLAAWCEARDAFRHFRLDRMQGYRITDQRIPIASSRLMAGYREVEPRIAI